MEQPVIRPTPHKIVLGAFINGRMVDYLCLDKESHVAGMKDLLLDNYPGCTVMRKTDHAPSK